MIHILMAAVILASPCVAPHHPHKVHHYTKLPVTVQSCVQALPSAALPASLKDDDIEPVTTGVLTKYLTITDTEPCHVYSSAYPTGFISGGYAHTLRAPELDPRSGIESVLMLTIGLLILDSRNSK